jgi:hypothetical protein
LPPPPAGAVRARGAASYPRLRVELKREGPAATRRVGPPRNPGRGRASFSLTPSRGKNAPPPAQKLPRARPAVGHAEKGGAARRGAGGPAARAKKKERRAGRQKTRPAAAGAPGSLYGHRQLPRGAAGPKISFGGSGAEKEGGGGGGGPPPPPPPPAPPAHAARRPAIARAARAPKPARPGRRGAQNQNRRNNGIPYRLLGRRRYTKPRSAREYSQRAPAARSHHAPKIKHSPKSKAPPA